MLRRIGQRDFDFARQVAVMAVVNRTPDSFYDQGSTFALDRAVAACLRAAEDGADWVDVGGVPFGRGPEVSEAEEIDRVVPVIAAVTAASDIVVSIDTYRSAVAAAAIAAGAAVVNDASALWDPKMLGVVASTGATIVLTHSLARPPRSEPPAPKYSDVVAEVAEFLRGLVGQALAAGITEDRIILDPGHDLNKTTVQTLELTRRLDEIVALGFPTLAAVSNKDFVGESIGREQGERLEGSLAAAVVSIMKGARILRMHDIPQAVDAVRMTEAILGWRAPAFERHNL